MIMVMLVIQYDRREQNLKKYSDKLEMENPNLYNNTTGEDASCHPFWVVIVMQICREETLGATMEYISTLEQRIMVSKIFLL